MKYFIVIALSVFTTIAASAQEVSIKTTDVSKENYYNIITYLNEGEPTDNGKVYRVVISTSEIYDSLIIETLTMGEEGGNVKVINRRKVDLENLWSVFHLTGEISGLKFIKWINPTSFSLKIANKIFVFKNINLTSLKVSTKE